MFNKTYNLNPRINVDIDAEITEVRAPTDASVRLLKEMEEAARKKLLDAIPIGNTNFDIKLVIERDNFDDGFACSLLMKINGERIVSKLSLPDGLRWMYKDERLNAIRDAVCLSLGSVFFKELGRQPKQRDALRELFGEKK